MNSNIDCSCPSNTTPYNCINSYKTRTDGFYGYNNNFVKYTLEKQASESEYLINPDLWFFYDRNPSWYYIVDFYQCDLIVSGGDPTCLQDGTAYGTITNINNA